jgi:glycosyltransferase involved in cell wall biosynthesis
MMTASQDENTLTVGIGLPVFNNATHLPFILDNLLNQTHQNIIIYLSDNASTDGTTEICHEYAKNDKRIIYHRFKSNLGATENHKKVLQMANTEYFMFCRGQEMISNNLVEDCLSTLLKSHDAVLAFSKTKWVDNNGDIITNKPIGYFDTMGFDVVTRCAVTLWGNWDYYYAMSKTSVLRNIRLHESVIGNDTLSLFEKALIGGFSHARSSIRYRRHTHGKENYKSRIKRYQTTTYTNLTFVDRIFPLIRLPFMLLYSVLKANIKFSQKLLIILLILFNAPIRYLVSKAG